MTSRRFAAGLTGIALLALVLRGLFPAADPPWRSTVGVVWHDEGAWVHNARNKALYGEWRQDEWNPVYIAPVFTALEYVAFRAFGVGVRQARLVSEIAGFLSVILLALGVRRIAGDRAGLIAGALLATNYVYVMYNRAAIMEALMAAFIVASWYCSTRAEREPRWGAAAGVMAALAFFTKAAAAFYVGALALVMVLRLAQQWNTGAGRNRPLDLAPKGGSHEFETGGSRETQTSGAALWTLAGLAVSFGLVLALFVLPHWSDYRFYNWQISVTRKPSYDLASVVRRVTWFPILHDTFSRMWGVLCLGVCGAWGIVARWRRAGDPERLLLLWVAIGSLELLVHDVSNERRFVFLIPALVALAGVVLVRGALLPDEARAVRRGTVLILAPLILYTGYVLAGPLTRVPFLEEVYAHVLRSAVRLAAVTGLVAGLAVVALWPRIAAGATRRSWSPAAAHALVALFVAWNVFQFGDWAVHRSYENYDASVALGRALPPDTLVQGKLANGLALENRIRPIFIGHEFGNYDDRKQRWDVRYILTYTDPAIGYEGDQIVDVLAAYPGWQIIMTFDVAETPSGHDRAALIEKRARH
ncbi:MAG TPA: glycosyltransferase family 39 protein [Vicinamibacterales bacterium]|nr:glycosyltransferase family 39 protein [Vicinamibacterales bacterium]